MKRNLLVLVSVLVTLLMTGCGGVKPYVDVTTPEYATLELTSTADTSGGSLTAYIEYLDCTDPIALGKVETTMNTSSRIVKIPVEKPLLIQVQYTYQFLYNLETYADTFVLIPEKNKRYVAKYVYKELSFTQALRDIDIFMLEDGKKVDVPDTRIRNYNHAEECK